MTMYEIKLTQGGFSSKSFIVSGYNEMEALENIYKKYRKTYPGFFISEDEFYNEVDDMVDCGWEREDAIQALDENWIYLDVDDGQYIGQVFSINLAPTIYQFMEYNGLTVYDPYDENACVYHYAYGDYLYECPECGAVDTLSEGCIQLEDRPGHVSWRCNYCGSFVDPDYVRLKDEDKILRYRQGPVKNNSTKPKMKKVKSPSPRKKAVSKPKKPVRRR